MEGDARLQGSLGRDRLDRRGFLRAGTALALTACVPGASTSPTSSARGRRATTEAAPADAKRTLAELDQTGSLAELATMDATEVAERVALGELSPIDTLTATSARIAALEPDLAVLAHSAVERARARIDRGRVGGPFAGVPTLLKDMVDCEGVTRSDGASRVFWRVPDRSPALVQAMEDSGFMILGSTNVPEFATLPVTVNETFGTTKNPWDPARTPGGSSGGSAAAVAAGLVPLAHGTDGSGSIRMPASCCGVFGFKPSRERTLSGEGPGGHPLLKHHHCLTRSVRDSVHFLSVTEDRRPAARYPSIFAGGWSARSDRSRRRLRIGVDRAGLSKVEPDAHVAAALDEAITLLDELGHEVVEMLPLFESGEPFWRNLEALFLSRMPALIRMVESGTGRPFDETDVLSPFTMSFARASRGLPTDAADRARREFDGLGSRVVEWMEGVDAFVSPVLPEAPPPVDRWGPRSDWAEVQGAFRSYMNHTPLANVIGAPAMSVPLHWTPEGWPIGTQFQARPGDDRLLFELAFELEAARPWADRWPPLSARRS